MTDEKENLENDKVKKVQKIKKVEAIRPVEKIAPIQKVEKIAKVRQPTLSLSAEERAKILKMVEEEAKSLVEKGLIPEKDEEVITKAVQYAISASIIEEEKGKG